MALARALAPQPQVLLLDEPLSALDAKIRVSLREEIRAIQRELGITTVFVTHDQEEALSISDRIVVMNAGSAEQIGTPFEIYNRPATRFVASFVGTLNMLEARSSMARPPAQSTIERAADCAAPAARRGRPARGFAGAAAGGGGARGGRRQRRGAARHGARRKLPGLGGAGPRRARRSSPLSLDIFNNAAVQPPREGEAVVVSFGTADALVTAA